MTEATEPSHEIWVFSRYVKWTCIKKKSVPTGRWGRVGEGGGQVGARWGRQAGRPPARGVDDPDAGGTAVLSGPRAVRRGKVSRLGASPPTSARRSHAGARSPARGSALRTRRKPSSAQPPVSSGLAPSSPGLALPPSGVARLVSPASAACSRNVHLVPCSVSA